MLSRINAKEIKVIATKSKDYKGYELRFKNAKTGADLYAKELPQGLFNLLASKHFAYKYGEKYFFNTIATAKDIKYFTSGEFFDDLAKIDKTPRTAKTQTRAKAVKTTRAQKSEPKNAKSQKADMLKQLGELFSDEQLRTILAMATK